MTNEYVNLLACISNVIDLIKGNSGFKDSGCYKHGLINDGEMWIGTIKPAMYSKTMEFVLK